MSRRHRRFGSTRPITGREVAWCCELGRAVDHASPGPAIDEDGARWLPWRWSMGHVRGFSHGDDR